MWNREWRNRVLKEIETSQKWDILIIGGGITGAGIFAEAARHHLRVLLVEQKDFCWGTSSRSSKLIHGGLRYLLQGDFLLTMHSAREREFLLKKYPGLVEPLSFLLPIYKGKSPSKWLAIAGLAIYDLLAGHWQHSFWNTSKLLSEEPSIAKNQLVGAVRFVEGTTDDVRQVLRLLHEGTTENSFPLNYMPVQTLIKEGDHVVGAIIKDAETGKEYEVKSNIVINATGIWSDTLRNQISQTSRMRPLRGSHLIFPSARLPVKHCVSFLHPKDRRPVFAYPWESITLVGTTDLDYRQSLSQEPSITKEEVDYLMAGLDSVFPELNLTTSDVISSFAGVRPVVGSGKAEPSKERRDSALWLEKGLLTVTGGKYTTFRLTARDTLKAATPFLPHLKLLPPEKIGEQKFPDHINKRLMGYYGKEAPSVLATFSKEDLKPIENTPIFWGELRWALRNEAVMHLEDLLLRRTRIGLLLPGGGKQQLDRIGQICREELNWSSDRWEQEKTSYLKLWNDCYSLPK